MNVFCFCCWFGLKDEAPFKDIIADYITQDGPWEKVKLPFSEIKEVLNLPERPNKLADSFPGKTNQRLSSLKIIR